MSRILIAEDDPTVSAMIVSFLESNGYTASAVHNGCETVSVAREFRPDAIILDLMMPGMTGAEVALHLRRHPLTSRIPIIAITALDCVDEFVDILMVDDVLSKPFDLEHLSASIDQMIKAPPGGLPYPDASNPAQPGD